MKCWMQVGIVACTLAACGGTAAPVPAAVDAGGAGGDGGAGHAGAAGGVGGSATPVACGSTKCGANQFCLAWCTGLPFYCSAPNEAGACGVGEHLTTNCVHGPGHELDAGCSDLEYHYACQPWSGETSYPCPGWGGVPINNGVAWCCHD